MEYGLLHDVSECSARHTHEKISMHKGTRWPLHCLGGAVLALAQNVFLDSCRSCGPTIEYADRCSTPRQTKNWRVILARASSLVNVLLTAVSACHAEGQARWSPTARVQRGSSETARCASTGDYLV